jgi:hypothetical protein
VEIAENIREIKAKAKSALIVAVTKNVEIPQIIEAIEAGITDIGENRVQEAKAKFAEIKNKFPDVKWHMIGHLQKNKVKAALLMFDVIQSVDSFELAEEIDKRANRIVECFIEINTSGEGSKYGVNPDDLFELLKSLSNLKNIKVAGLMAMGPLTQDKDLIRRSFRKLRELRDRAQAGGFPDVKHLSMGMSDDYPLAIDEGSDIIRVGRAVFKRKG